jgi:hypothetical protein
VPSSPTTALNISPGDLVVWDSYLAKKSLAAFNARLHEETDLDALSEGLVGVAGIMQCKHISLYLRPETSSKEARTEQRPLIHPSA